MIDKKTFTNNDNRVRGGINAGKLFTELQKLFEQRFHGNITINVAYGDPKKLKTEEVRDL